MALMISSPRRCAVNWTLRGWQPQREAAVRFFWRVVQA
jgi:hypothetical protein